MGDLLGSRHLAPLFVVFFFFKSTFLSRFASDETWPGRGKSIQIRPSSDVKSKLRKFPYGHLLAMKATSEALFYSNALTKPHVGTGRWR